MWCYVYISNTCLSISDAKILISTNHLESNKVPFMVIGYSTDIVALGVSPAAQAYTGEKSLVQYALHHSVQANYYTCQASHIPSPPCNKLAAQTR